jgi:hypothetical protein
MRHVSPILITEPAGVTHLVTTPDSETVVQATGTAPTKVDCVDPVQAAKNKRRTSNPLRRHRDAEAGGCPDAICQMKLAILVLVIMLSACATDRPPGDCEKCSSGPTVYGQLSVSVDRVSVGR